MTISWSKQQQSIFEFFKHGQGNLVVRARAGTGKTTTIVEGVKHAPDNSILLAAFNKSIATELQRKLVNPNAEAKTLHGVGNSFIYEHLGKTTLDFNLPWKQKRSRVLSEAAIVKHTKNAVAPGPVVTMIGKLMTLGREMAPFAESGDDLIDIAFAFELIPDAGQEAIGWTVGRVCDCAYVAMQLAKAPSQIIDFTDMLFLPVVNGWAKPRYDLVCVDEAQDMNACQLMLALKVCRPTGRIVVVGDDRQAIYGFRGADSGSIDRLKNELDAVELGLTTTYRCPALVVDEANRLVPDYDAAPNAPEGVISRVLVAELPEVAEPGNFVLSRTNAPLAKVCLEFLRNNVRAMIKGKDIGKRLQTISKKLADNNNYLPLDQFLSALAVWEQEEIQKALKAEKEGRAGQVADQAETLRILCEGMKTVKDLLFRIDDLFGEPAKQHGVVICSTVHKAKGLESKRVFILGETFYPGRRDKMSPGRLLEESNIEYVAITRTMEELTWVTGLL